MKTGLRKFSFMQPGPWWMGPNQYAPVEGVPELRQTLADDNKRFYNLDIDPETETLVTSGATEGLAAAFFGFLGAWRRSRFVGAVL